MSSNSLQSLIYEQSGSLKVLDQLLIPNEKKYIDVPDIQTTWSVIRTMQIRGAPLIAIVACLGLAVDLQSTASTSDLDAIERMNGVESSADAILAYIQGKLDYLATSRPTAVNLFNALAELRSALLLAKEVDTTTTASSSGGGENEKAGNLTTPRQRMVQAVIQHAEFMLERDINDCRAIGEHGANEILKEKATDDHAVTVMTICNTGSLATAGYGTALGVVRALRERNKLKQVIALETRPYNQGSRLTAFEIVEEDMPNGTLICDSMAAARMAKGDVDAVVVGADRVCANGDTANKIGTYNLSLVAKAHGVPLYVAAPFTTLDLALKSGDEIVIEERPAEEILSTSRAPPSIKVWNPAFDVTPAKYIAGIITEKGVILPTADGQLDVAAFVAKFSDPGVNPVVKEEEETTSSSSKLKTPAGYTEQSVASLPAYLAQNAPDAMQELGATVADELDCVEVGDGNLNLVFIVTNKKNAKQVIVKQALPYVRCVGESWPLTLERSYFEYMALSVEKEACPEFVPSLYYFSKTNGLMVMQYLAPPNIILRKGLIQGIRYPTMASDMGVFCAKTLFKTSGFKLGTSELREKVEFWSKNTEMCALTEQVVFTEPYIEAANNRWTSPQLDDEKKAIENDEELKIKAARYKAKFVTETQALIHADLHSGSVMCSPAEHQTFVIDPEFAFYGPMGFDTGAFVANLFLAHVSQAGHSNGNDYAEWILEQIGTFWNTFTSEFVAQWEDPAEHTGFLYGRTTLSHDEVKSSQDDYLRTLLADTLGFAGMKMLRRIVGIAHVEDLESIKDADTRAQCERRGLAIAKTFIKTATSISSIEAAIQIARDTVP